MRFFSRRSQLHLHSPQILCAMQMCVFRSHWYQWKNLHSYLFPHTLTQSNDKKVKWRQERENSNEFSRLATMYRFNSSRYSIGNKTTTEPEISSVNSKISLFGCASPSSAKITVVVNCSTARLHVCAFYRYLVYFYQAKSMGNWILYCRGLFVVSSRFSFSLTSITLHDVLKT